ncbi:Uroporphyrinogen decarboxylase (URO-D) [uncultured Roseburia sp.]|uniref:Uroporphyrinogen decarboxylase (URO-D) domain-containing protein n=1 Tax=Brotonthovivens ammoniilytica TaxID=2981725 RepID=A0ABT2TNV3_9FIRM|nr:uroporphyrinogen decarboxylase family protein [Brotonthovivens ammoniilytica]MCU6763767.1 hypothetical protein [Brotonthovivens ammoniilytica]SCJ34291.1 Uroporphyrinogen decarboxylase (URO-D) [uncultured Roseburia sp.]
MSTYEKRLKRIQDAIDLKESDRVPWAPFCQGYLAYHAGYSMKDIVYDMDKARHAFAKFVTDYNPDMLLQIANNNVGMGPVWEQLGMKNLAWAGGPDHRVDDDSIHQFLEYPLLNEEEMEEFCTDFSGWLITKGFSRVAALFEGMEQWKFNRINPTFNGLTNVISTLSTPESKKMIRKFWEIEELIQKRKGKLKEIENMVENMGYPVLDKGGAAVPFDRYSDIYRGTLDSLTDLYDNEDIILSYCRQNLKIMKEMIREQGKFLKGQWVFIALHKGMDGFMSDEQYAKYYWKDLLEVIEEIVACDMVPYIFTEGKYDSRLEYLKEVPKGKTVIHIEDCNMKEVKRILGNTACIEGGFPSYLLEHGTKEEVINTCKYLIDNCASGGGYIFSTDGGMDRAKPELLEAAMDTVLTYGSK